MANKKRIYAQKHERAKKEAKKHVDALFIRAKENSTSNPSLANRYVTLARKIAMKFKLRLTPEQKRLFCPHCYRFLSPTRNLRVRVHESRIIYYCLDCKKYWRKPVKTKKKEKK